MAAADTSTGVGELKDELFELLDEVEDRGIGASAEVVEDLFEVVGELETLGPPIDEWPQSPLLGGRWELTYTSSRTFANNEGLSGYARDIGGISTPETYMNFNTKFRLLEYEEPVEFEKGSLAAVVGRFAGAAAIKVECAWAPRADGTMAVDVQRVVVGSNTWPPADRQDKAVRVLSACRPIFLDEDLLVMRGQPEYIVWIFERA